MVYILVKTFVFKFIYGVNAFPISVLPIQPPVGVANSIHIHTHELKSQLLNSKVHTTLVSNDQTYCMFQV